MKKTLLMLFASCIFANISYAQLGGGFEGPSGANNATVTVKQALSMRDESNVVLKGHIVNSLGDEKYTFSDGTAEIIIEIDDEDWAGRKITPENTIEIYGEVDKEMFEPTKIDVDSFNVK